MLTGIPPFFCKDREKLFEVIQVTEPQYPDFLTQEVVDLIQHLLIKDPAHRLGASEDGAAQIKMHPFFSGINWDDILHKRVKPPFIPRLKGNMDTRYIDTAFTGATPKDTPGGSEIADSGLFTGFSYDINNNKDKTGKKGKNLIDDKKKANNEDNKEK